VSENIIVSPDQQVAQLTASQLETLIAAVVRRVVREELRRDYYVDEHGRHIVIDDVAQHDAAYSTLAKVWGRFPSKRASARRGLPYCWGCL